MFSWGGINRKKEKEKGWEKEERKNWIGGLLVCKLFFFIIIMV